MGGNTQTSIYNMHIFTRVSKPALFMCPFKSTFYLELMHYVCNAEIFFNQIPPNGIAGALAAM